MHLFTNGIRLWVFIRCPDRFDVPKTEQILESNALKLSPIIMDDSHRFRVLRKLCMLKTSNNMVTRLFKDSCDFNKVDGGVNASESKEFHRTMWC